MKKARFDSDEIVMAILNAAHEISEGLKAVAQAIRESTPPKATELTLEYKEKEK
jgi:hypothetical protein